MRKLLYLHVGMHKTGSSAIQALLTLNNMKLQDKGFFFPNPPNFDQAYQTSEGNAGFLYKLFVDNELDEIKKYIESIEHSKIILSSEYLFQALLEYPERFFKVFNDYDYKIICYVRRQDDLFSSMYNQMVKNHDLEDKLSALKFIEGKSDFHKVLFECLKYTELENVIVRPYEKQQFYKGNIYSDFLNCIGLELEESYCLPEKIVNPSLSWDSLEFRRLLNSMAIDRDEPLRKFPINELLARYTVEMNRGEPFGENNTFPSKKRIEIINSFYEKNKQIANRFLHRKSGELFLDPLPDIDKRDEWNKQLSIEDMIKICRYILSSTYQDDVELELLKVIAKGTIEKILTDNDKCIVEVNNYPVIYTLNDVPTYISNDITSFERKLNLWYIESSGGDPHFSLPNFTEASHKKEVLVKVDILSSCDTILELFYQTSNREFDADHCVKRYINKGYNEIVIRLKEPENITSLRLDPSNLQGVFLIYLLEVREVTSE
ncbi:MAG: hypothetical protein P0Y55_15375 [Candidatus Cohnella colombiensis]|uniref:Sulfotransferase domain-containing protein n=1 Tax=Candidatus Cohnella colombiensis TaxID=3121368 RepID=A0AA95EVW5_9BACL|nr:MAG: hypothetical protein P0Y55_15375 [Cohnella sp.]